jgi:hypothetical protein
MNKEIKSKSYVVRFFFLVITSDNSKVITDNKIFNSDFIYYFYFASFEASVFLLSAPKNEFLLLFRAIFSPKIERFIFYDGLLFGLKSTLRFAESHK